MFVNIVEKRILIILGFAASTLSAQVTSTWTGLGDGSNFFDPGNWDNGVPGFQDTAVFDGAIAGDGVTINFDTSNIDIDSLVVKNSVETGPILSGNNSIFVVNSAVVDAIEINSNGGTDQFITNGGSFEINGNLGAQFSDRILFNGGVFSIAGNGQVSFANTSIDNAGVMVLDSDASIFNGGNSVVNNTGGTISKETSTGMTAFGVDVVNSGVVQALSGTLQFNGNFQQDSGDLILDNGAEIAFANSLTTNAGGVLGNGQLTNNIGPSINMTGMTVDPIGNPEEVISEGQPPEPGKIDFFGDYNFDPTSIFFFDVFGPSTNEYDRIEFLSGTADLTAEPDIAVFGDASIKSLLSPSDVLDILTGPYSGQFSFLPNGSLVEVFDFNTFEPLGTFEILYGSGVIQLTNFTPVPEPRTWAMLVLGALVIGGWARRRLRASCR